MNTPPVCNYEGSDYQSSFWDKGGRAYEDGAEEVALKRLLPRSGKLMLELGAGAGRNTHRYQGFEQVVLLDYSFTQLQQARKRLGGSERYRYVAADVYKLPFVDGLFRLRHHDPYPAPHGRRPSGTDPGAACAASQIHLHPRICQQTQHQIHPALHLQTPKLEPLFAGTH